MRWENGGIKIWYRNLLANAVKDFSSSNLHIFFFFWDLLVGNLRRLRETTHTHWLLFREKFIRTTHDSGKTQKFMNFLSSRHHFVPSLEHVESSRMRLDSARFASQPSVTSAHVVPKRKSHKLLIRIWNGISPTHSRHQWRRQRRKQRSKSFSQITHNWKLFSFNFPKFCIQFISYVFRAERTGVKEKVGVEPVDRIWNFHVHRKSHIPVNMSLGLMRCGGSGETEKSTKTENFTFKNLLSSALFLTTIH